MTINFRKFYNRRDAEQTLRETKANTPSDEVKVAIQYIGTKDLGWCKSGDWVTHDECTALTVIHCLRINDFKVFFMYNGTMIEHTPGNANGVFTKPKMGNHKWL